jgi:hypothetical protein
LSGTTFGINYNSTVYPISTLFDPSNLSGTIPVAYPSPGTLYNFVLVPDSGFTLSSVAVSFGAFNKIYFEFFDANTALIRKINFSRIAVRNNHAITETLALTVSELLFPFIPETKKWSKEGRKWLEQEIDYQVYEDGTFLQFSMNYNRVLVQLLSLGIAITEKNNQPFSDKFYFKAYKTLNFLYQCMQEENGFLPNYGANDGALFFPLSENQYRDYRPQLNTLHLILTGKKLFEEKKNQ